MAEHLLRVCLARGFISLQGSTLTINGSGSLEVHGASGNTKGSVGIGGMGSSGYAGGACGNVLILEGTIKVHGGTPTYSMGKQPVDIGGGDSDMQKGGTVIQSSF